MLHTKKAAIYGAAIFVAVMIALGFIVKSELLDKLNFEAEFDAEGLYEFALEYIDPSRKAKREEREREEENRDLAQRASTCEKAMFPPAPGEPICRKKLIELGYVQKYVLGGMPEGKPPANADAAQSTIDLDIVEKGDSRFICMGGEPDRLQGTAQCYPSR